jgi:hypothetical protein
MTSALNDIFNARPVTPCIQCGATSGFTPKGICNGCGQDGVGDGVALLSVAEPPGLTEKLAEAIRDGRLAIKSRASASKDTP